MASMDKFKLVPYQLTPEQEEPGTDDVQTFDIVLHNQFRPRSCIGTSMQYQIGCVAPDHELLCQDSNAFQGTHFPVCVQIPKMIAFSFPTPLSYSLKMQTTQRHQTREQAVPGVGALSLH